MISLTALVLTYNEQENIRRNLEALVWVPKAIIVDSFSNDQTLEIARSFPNVQVVQRVFDTHANQWNAGLDRIDTEWALTLDADYVLTAELQEEIKKLEPASDIALYWGEFDYCIFGRPLRGLYLVLLLARHVHEIIRASCRPLANFPSSGQSCRLFIGIYRET